MTERKELIYYRSLMCLVASLLLSYQASAQLHSQQLPDNKMLVAAAEQYQQGYYRMAAQSAGKYIASQQGNVLGTNADAADKAAYYVAASQLKTADAGSVDNATAYLKRTANPAYKQRMAFSIAQYYFKNNQPASAIPYYEMAGIANLNNSEIADSKFELAYCYFNMKQFDKAAPLLQSIKELDGKYYLAGNYYYGLLAYNQANYEEAKTSFDRIANDKDYKAIVPYYIAEIYYFTGNKTKALQEAKRLMKRQEILFYNTELHLLAAQILFEENKFAEALPYFEHYYNNVDKIRKEDLYEMAYCYYDAKDWNKAIDKFTQLSDTRDSLGQTAMYLLGDCYLKTNNAKSARNAFTICADMDFNPSQKEAALLLAAKLSYQMGYNDEALNRINELLAVYPDSKYKDEAKTLLSDLFIKTNNYTAAFNALQDVQVKNAAYKQVWQKVAYGYAMQQLQSGNMTFADSLLDMALQYIPDEKYEMAANFWKSELAYKMRRFPEVITYSERFVTKATVNKQAEIISPVATLQNAYVNMGYAAMEQKDFEAAQWYFNQAQLRTEDAGMAMNAILREADAVFMQKGYLRSISLYEKVIAANGEDADYARFQKGIVLGVIGKRAEKVAIMHALINAKPASKYQYDARYELALANIEEDKYQQAIAMLLPLTVAQEKNNYASRAWMKIGFCQQQLNADEKAIDAYKRVVTEYPAAEERGAALDALKSLYIENNQPQAFAQLLKDNNIRVVDDNSLDSTYYSAAEGQYASGNWVKAKQSLGEYLKQYPYGVFATKAHYYKAESHYQLNEMKEALAGYDAVLQKGWSDFAERSALKAAALAVLNNDNTAALTYYGKLRNYAMAKENLQEAYTGMMRSSYYLKSYNEAAAYADTLLTLPNVADVTLTEGTYIKAKSLYEAGRQEEAYPLFAKLTTNKKTIIAAEANYYVATSLYNNNKLKEAEEAANKAIKMAGGNDFITLKSYLLITDVLVKQNDYFNAKALLQSIIKNAKVPALKQEAQQKLDEIKATEKKQGKLKQD